MLVSGQHKSNYKYLVKNPVQAALLSYGTQKAKKKCWLDKTLRPEAYGNLFKIGSKRTPHWIMHKILSDFDKNSHTFHENKEGVLFKIRLLKQTQTILYGVLFMV